MTVTRFALEPYGPDKDCALSFYEGGSAMITSTGPRGGWNGQAISAEALPKLARHLVEHLTGRYVCGACFRPEEDCSAAPCETVERERGE